jgi:hypothetical protein
MVPYQMNLAQGHILTLATRKQWRRWLTVYFLLVLVILGWSVGLLMRNGIALVQQRERLSLREGQFLGQRPGVDSMKGHMRSLCQKMAICESQLSAIDSFRKEDYRSAAVILGLVAVMPAGMDLGQVSIDGIAAKMNCEIYVSAGVKNADSMTPPRLMSLWSAEPLLIGRVNHFTSEKSERVMVDNQDVTSWRFSGVLGGGK